MKPKVAFYWCAGCGGCEEAVLDLAEDVLPVLEAVDIVFWPVALDFKEKDVAAMADGAIDIAFINGAVRTSEQETMARLLRAKAKCVVAFGACAQSGGIPGLANLWRAADLVREAYGEHAPQTSWRSNGHALELPTLFDTVLPLSGAIAVDYFVPGCPPTPNIVAAAIQTLLGPDRPAPGAVLAPDRALCDECPRKDTREPDMVLKNLRRVTDAVVDPAQCILAQGFACLGAATRSGCGARCISGNMPCTGCFGPTGAVRDYGAKALTSIASLIAKDDEEDIDKVLDGLPDPVGTFYRYSLPASLLARKRME